MTETFGSPITQKMPLYTFRNTKTDEVIEEIMTISAMEEFIADGEWKQIIGAPNLVTHTGSIVSKTSEDWRSHLKSIKKRSGTRVKNSIHV